MSVDVTFDVRTDSDGLDPDQASQTLKRFHQYLWTKTLPSGELFKLDDRDSKYLTFNGSLGSHVLASDSIVNSFSHHKRLKDLLVKIEPTLLKDFRDLNSTIGGFIVFPGNRVDGKATINGERGFNSLVADRFDLTLECIRRYYLELESPLTPVLGRYSSFFSLFKDFRTYVDFFLLNDLVDDNYSRIYLFNSFGEIFQESPLPKEIGEYLEYRENSMLFTSRRNKRIESWAKAGH